MLTNLRIQWKVSLMAGIMLVLLAVVGFLGFFGAQENGAIFSDYRSVARQEMLLADIGEDLLQARLAALKFRAHDDQRHIDEVNGNIDEIREAVHQASALVRDKALKQAINDMLENMSAYGDAFADAVEADAEDRERIYDTRLDVIGPAISSRVDGLQNQLQETQNTLGPMAQANVEDTQQRVGAGVLVATVLAILTAYLMARAIARPIVRTTDLMRHIAETDDTTRTVEGTERKDEIGDMARALKALQGGIAERQRLKDESEASEARQAEQRRELMTSLANDFDQTVGGIVDSIEQASDQLSTMAQTLTTAVERTSERSATVAAAAEESDANVQTAASAVEEMSASIRDIAANVAETATASKEATEAAQASHQTLETLRAAVSDIDTIVRSINDVAEQTSLLSLNATIEAARAGDAGKGFAVVASEVKALATQTHRMTEEIAKKAANIEAGAQAAISGLEEIGNRIVSVDSKAAAVAGVLDQQNAAATEVSRNVSEAASGTRDVSSAIADVQQSNNDGVKTSRDLTDSAQILAQQSRSLRKAASAFIDEVRAA